MTTLAISNRVPALAWGFWLLLAWPLLSGEESSLGLLAWLVLGIGLPLLWRNGEPPILLLLLVVPWLQASAFIFKANLSGVPLYRLDHIGGDIEQATALSLWSLLFMSIGLRFAAGPWQLSRVQAARDHLLSQPPARWIQLYLTSWVVLFVLANGLRYVPGMLQLAVALDACRWVFFGAMTWAVFGTPSGGRLIWALAFAAELVYGLTGFFSSFKTVVLVTLLFLSVSSLRIGPLRAVMLTIVAVLMLSLGVLWSTVKQDYRVAMSGFSGNQSSELSVAERLTLFTDMVGSLKSDQLMDGASAMLDRLSYVEFFGRVLNVVPAYLPHEDGALWADAYLRPLMPRLLFPEKGVIDDTERTMQYTLIDMAQNTSSTSISLGWVAEAYIDFGVPGMFLLALLLGATLGGIHRLLGTMRLGRGIWGVAMATAVLLPAIFIETSITKLAGGLVAMLLTAWLLLKFGLPRLAPWAVPRD